MKKTHIIIGTSAAGIGAAQTLRKLDPEAEIICISNEQSFPYNKCFLADYLAGKKIKENLYTKTPDFFEKNTIQLLLNIEVTNIDVVAKTVMLNNTASLSYDTLFLGMGKKVVPLFPQQQSIAGFFTFHDADSIFALEEYIKVKEVHSVIIIGAGLTGIECADALKKYTVNITIVERGDRVLSAYCDDESSFFLQKQLAQAGISVVLNEHVKEIVCADNRVRGVCLATGKELRADMIISAVGAQVNSELAKYAGIDVHPVTKAVITNEYLQTNHHDVYAGGDVIMVYDQLKKEYVPNCLWADAMLQGSFAAQNMAGYKKPYAGTVMLSTSTFFGMQFAACGSMKHIPETYNVMVKNGESFYHKFLLQDWKLQGFLLMGPEIPLSTVRRAVLTQEEVDLDLI